MSSSIAVGVLVEFEGMDASPAQTPATESEQQLDLLDSFIESGEGNTLYSCISNDSDSSTVLSFPPNHPLPPPQITTSKDTSSLGSCATHFQNIAKPVTQPSSPLIIPIDSPHPPFSGEASSWSCWEVTPSGRQESMALPPALSCSVLPRPVDLAPAPTLLLPSTPAPTIEHSDSPGSLGTSAPPGSDVAKPPLRTCGPYAALWPSTPSASASSALPQAPPPPSFAPARPLLSTFASESRHCGFVAAAQVIGIPSPPRTSVCAGIPHSKAPSPLVISTNPPSRLLPPLTSPWVIALAVLWVTSTWPLLPPPIPPWSLSSIHLPVSSSCPWPHPHPPPKPPPFLLPRREDTPFRRGGVMSQSSFSFSLWTFCLHSMVTCSVSRLHH
ncbi:protein enabled homolog [Megalobrama amblycephala]|uniref:protein enabled homolog n=1 Tax=Megalobrama amblycephala TaxID=75352 RepID=UPI0020142E81|nr:protein enabled homolog [Megalobrama amblycephala]